MAPLYSTVILCGEIVISFIVLYSIYSGWTKNKFPAILAGFALLYEILFNVSYMVSRVRSHLDVQLETPTGVALAIFHGTLSLVMFLALVAFFALAWKNYRKGVNYFKKHNIFTGVFVTLWIISVLSGILLYYIAYYTHF